jgi:hypothetical protein
MNTKKISQIYKALKKELGKDPFREILTNLGLQVTEDGKGLFFVEGREAVGTKIRYNIGQLIQDIQRDYKEAVEKNETEYSKMLQPAFNIIEKQLSR